MKSLELAYQALVLNWTHLLYGALRKYKTTQRKLRQVDLTEEKQSTRWCKGTGLFGNELSGLCGTDVGYHWLNYFTGQKEGGRNEKRSRGRRQGSSTDGCLILFALWSSRANLCLLPLLSLTRKPFSLIRGGKGRREWEFLWKTGMIKLTYQFFKINKVIQKCFISFMNECYIWKKK